MSSAWNLENLNKKNAFIRKTFLLFHTLFLYKHFHFALSCLQRGPVDPCNGIGEVRQAPTSQWSIDLHSLCFISNTVNEGLVAHFSKFHSRCLALLSCCLFSSKNRLVSLLIFLMLSLFIFFKPINKENLYL